MKNNKYNGWANYETWNVALWIQNVEKLYNIAKQFDNWKDFINLGMAWAEVQVTGDDISFTDKKLNIKQLDKMIKDLT
jgi:hypothetical protein